MHLTGAASARRHARRPAAPRALPLAALLLLSLAAPLPGARAAKRAKGPDEETQSRMKLAARERMKTAQQARADNDIWEWDWGETEVMRPRRAAPCVAALFWLLLSF